MLSLMQILMVILDVMWFFVIAHVIMSWLINFRLKPASTVCRPNLVWPQSYFRAGLQPYSGFSTADGRTGPCAIGGLAGALCGADYHPE